MADARVADTTARELRESVHLEALAECLYETASLCDRILIEVEDRGWNRLPVQDKARYRFAALAALNGLSPSRRYEAELRTREQVAHLPHIGKAFGLLPGAVQRQIVHANRTVIHTYLRVLEGLFEPLPARYALDLEPVTEASDDDQ